MIKTTNNKYKTFVVKLREARGFRITFMASLLLIFVFLGAASYLFLQSSAATGAYRQASSNAYRQALEDAFRTENVQQEWKRLYKYHGNPAAVIYEPGKTPYFYDKQGNKCAFLYPSKGAGPVAYKSDDNNYYAALTLNP